MSNRQFPSFRSSLHSFKFKRKTTKFDRQPRSAGLNLDANMGRRRGILADEVEQFTSLFNDLRHSLGNLKSWFRKDKRRTSKPLHQEDTPSLYSYRTASETLGQNLEFDLSPTDLALPGVLVRTSEDGNPVVLDGRVMSSPQGTATVQRQLTIREPAAFQEWVGVQELFAVQEPVKQQINTPQFAMFSLLPAEIRALIWKFSLGPPRIIEMMLPSRNGKFVLPNDPLPPVALRVCRESRAEALRYGNCYSFGVPRLVYPATRKNDSVAPGRPTYVNFSTDLFFWNIGCQAYWQQALLECSPSAFRDLPRMAFLGSCLVRRRTLRWLVDILSNCAALEELILVYTSVARKALNKVDRRGRRAERLVIGGGCGTCEFCLDKPNYYEKLKEMKRELESMMATDKRFKEAGRKPPKVTLNHMWLVKDA